MLLTYLPELKISAQSDVIYPGVIAPRSPKMGSIESWNKTVVFFHGKVENSEYPEAETSHSGNIDGLNGPIIGYVRISDDW